LSDLKGKAVVINFWATWCVPCTHEIPSLQKLYEKYKGEGFEILAVSTDDDASKIRSFVAKNKLTFLILNDPALREKLGIEGIPANLFIDRQGRIRYRKTGFEEGDEREFEVVIKELLK
jgi:peroxiredoxin